MLLCNFAETLDNHTCFESVQSTRVRLHSRPLTADSTGLPALIFSHAMTPMIYAAGVPWSRPARFQRPRARLGVHLAGPSRPAQCEECPQKPSVTTRAFGLSTQQLAETVSSIPLLNQIIRNDATLVLGELSRSICMCTALLSAWPCPSAAPPLQHEPSRKFLALKCHGQWLVPLHCPLCMQVAPTAIPDEPVHMQPAASASRCPSLRWAEASSGGERKSACHKTSSP